MTSLGRQSDLRAAEHLRMILDAQCPTCGGPYLCLPTKELRPPLGPWFTWECRACGLEITADEIRVESGLQAERTKKIEVPND